MILSIYPRSRRVLIIGIACLLASFAGVLLVAAHKNNNLPPAALAQVPASYFDSPKQARIAEHFGRLPLSFEINKGQINESVKFLSHGAGYDLFLTSTEAVLSVQKPRGWQVDKLKDPALVNTALDAHVREGSVLRLKMLGANATPQVEGQDELPGKVNYFIGNDPEKWRRNIPTYRRAYFKNIYPGIGVVYYGKQRELEYDLVVAAGANPKLIRFSVEGADQIRLDKTGTLLLRLKQGEITLNKPVIYQLNADRSRSDVKGAYAINGNVVSFRLERYDSSKTLIIDPVLSYSTLLGSGTNDSASGIAVDSQGSAYVTGTTESLSFPTTSGAFKSTATRGGAFVTKLDPTGSTLIYSTYLSGNDSNTNGFGIAVDSAGNAHVTGTTSGSPDFPVVNGLKTNSNFFKSTDAAVTWNNQNTGLVGIVNALAVAPNAPNTIYATASDKFYRSTDGGATWANATGTNLPSSNFTNTMAVDPTNSSVVYIGHFFSLYKTTDGGNNWSGVNTAPQSFGSVFSIVFDPSTPSTMYVGASTGVFKSTDSGSTWITQNNFGISGTPNVHALAIDPTAPLTIFAGTFGNGLFKSTNGGGVWTAMNNGMGGGAPTFVSTVVIDPANPSTIYTGHGSTPGAGGINKSTNGGTSWTPLTTDVPNAAVTSMVATSSAIYAVSNGIIKTTNGGSSWTTSNTGLWSPAVNSLVKHPTDAAVLYAGTIGSGFADAFVTKLNSSGSGLLFSTLLGGSRDESGNGIAVDGGGNISIAGQTNSSNFPVANAVRSTVTFNGNCGTGFVTKLNPAVPSYTFSTYLGGDQCDIANSVATDGSGNVYVTGRTQSPDFPIANAFQPALGGPPLDQDAFVTKLTTSGSLIYSTYLGGSSPDNGFGIAADASGNAYVTGFTSSTNFPTMNPIQANKGGGDFPDAFVTKFNSQGSALVYSTYLGGSESDAARGIVVDSANNAYLTGTTRSIQFPLVTGALRTKSPVYRSIDGAVNWSNDNYGFTAASITSMAINPAQPATLYVGTQNGVFKSTNGGRTWSESNTGLTNLNVAALVIDPLTPSTVYVAISGLMSGNGVYKSTDGGNTWSRRSNGITSTELLSLAIDPVTPNTLYLGVAFCCVIGNHVYKTTDGADTWAVGGNSPPSGPSVPSSLAIDPLNHSTIYAADSLNPGGVFKSTDAGMTWQSGGLAGPTARSVAVSPFTPGLVYAGTDQGVFRSVDGGNNWSLIPSRFGKIVFDPVSSSTLYLLSNPFAFNPEGLLKSTDSGQTWFPMNKGLNTPTPVALVINPLRPSTLYLASTPIGGSDAFVTKINAAGNALIYSTLIGGPPAESSSSTGTSAFAIALDNSGNAYITGLSSSLSFPFTPDSYQPFIRGGNDAFITKLGMSYGISGQVLDNGISPVSGAEILLNDGTSLTSVLTESDGTYQFPRLREGGTFTVSATKPHFTMTPSSQTFNNLNSDQVLNFTATATDAPFHTVSGQVTEDGVALAGVTVTLSGSQPGLRTTDINGNYSFEVAEGGNYTVTPSSIGFNFGPSSQTFNNLSANQTANFAATRQNFVVTNSNNHGSGSLRDAIINANATLGPDTIVFNIPGPGVKTISLLTALPEITDRVVIDATTQPGYAGSPLIELDGLAFGSVGSGLVIKAGGSTVRGLAIGNFRLTSGIWLNGCDNNTIQGNYLGVAANGTTARPNTRGILLTNSSNNVIGGTTAAARNVISGNLAGGIDIGGSGNVVQGNFIGTNAAGTAALPQPGGVSIFGSSFTDNLIGGTAAGAGNLISGHQLAVQTTGTGTTIQGNLIGTNVTGTDKIPNSNGVQALGTNMLVGGLTPGARNVVSGNQGDGVYIRGAGSKVQGNYIGTDITGTLALGNNGNGVVAGENALVGGTVPEARNIISANGSLGNVALGFNNSGSAATVQGNYIGTDITGTRALGSSAISGIYISSSNNLIGGLVAGARNVISGNSVGIQITTSGPVVGNVIQGNYIGVNALGTGPVPNTQQGFAIFGAVNNTIGGTQNEAGNKIAFNGGPGVSVSSGAGNVIRGNSIFSNTGLGIDLGADGVTANDIDDSDTGPNQLQNFPVIVGVMSTSNSTTIQGSLNSIPNTTFQIDFYSNAAVDPSGNGEGAQFLDTTAVNTDGNGDASINVTFPISLAAGRVITATATDPNGNTSEFSAADFTSAVGSVQFSVSSIQVIEDVGIATVTVLRAGGTAGNLTVDYSTVDGTALAGQDYSSASGTLSFLGGETSKTIQIPILDDATTEPDETFTVELSNTSSLESLGAPSVLKVTIQDRTTTPTLSITSASVVEGSAGSTTEALFTINLSAATGRAVSGNYASSDFSAFGGATCNNQGVDYETTSGMFAFNPGATTLTIPIKICGDSSAESNETFRVVLSNPSGATVLVAQGVGTILNDDVLELSLEESGPLPDQAAALDAILTLRDPFRVVGIPEWFPTGNDKNTRVALFARNLQLNPGELPSAVIVRFTASNNQIFEVPAEDVRSIPNSEFTQVVVRLPNNLAAGTCMVFIRAHTVVSNSGTLRIAQ
jgi:Calx-beta domain/Carboxypeptidase regulatory-like domain/Beta-propeller repeat